jgi:hypothetical protein
MIQPEVVGAITERSNLICNKKGYAITIPESHVKIVLEAYMQLIDENKEKSDTLMLAQA